jgi:hypothetical protein
VTVEVCEGTFGGVKSQAVFSTTLALPRVGPVTGVTLVREDRLDVAVEIDFLCG